MIYDMALGGPLAACLATAGVVMAVVSTRNVAITRAHSTAPGSVAQPEHSLVWNFKNDRILHSVEIDLEKENVEAAKLAAKLK